MQERDNRWGEFKSIYDAFMINRYLSMDPNLVPYASLMTNSVLTPEMQYDFLLRTIPKKQRYLKYIKKNKNNDESIQLLMDDMDVTKEKAKEMLLVLETIKKTAE